MNGRGLRNGKRNTNEGRKKERICMKDIEKYSLLKELHTLENCNDDECMICGIIHCPHGEPLHFHHDGCPACYEDEIGRPKRLIDLADMPSASPDVTNNSRDVTSGDIFWTDDNLVTCKEHGACLCVNIDRSIWRCPACNKGAFVEWEE